jgi:hypothetical protein
MNVLKMNSDSHLKFNILGDGCNKQGKPSEQVKPRSGQPLDLGTGFEGNYIDIQHNSHQ